MKKIFLYILVINFLSVVYSCSDSTLDLVPLDRVTTDSFFKTRDDFDGAIFAAYSSIQDFWGTSTENLGERGEYWKITMVITDDVAADNVTADGISRDIDNFQIRSGDVPFAAVYTQIYEGIFRANLVLENLDKENELTTEDKQVLASEAKFLRAWFHFQALKLFGTPPLSMEVVTDLNNLALPNSTKDELFTAIIADFNDAANGLPDSWDASNTGRATAWAAKSYIGKVNVWKKDWQSAILSFEEVINNGPYSLLPNYDDVFAFDNENNAESIFELQYGGPNSDDNIWVFDDTHSEAFKASQGTGRGWFWDAANGAPGGKLGWWVPTQDLVNEFEPGDNRADVSFYKDGDRYFTTFVDLPYDTEWSSTDFTLKKYRGQRNMSPANHAPNQQADFNNERLFRFAELKLLYAEALIEVGRNSEAIAQINDIRNRAGLADLSSEAAAEPMVALRHEKRIELAFEPHRWFDITRWEIGSSIFGSDWEDRFNVFPFPLSEITRSRGLLVQNPGY